jgi:stage II sporulation protein AA (anti-sigma F factor antagonist)
MSRMLPRPSCGVDHVLAHGAAPGGAGGLLSWAIQPRGRRVIVRLDGELDTDTAPRLARQIEPLAETGSHLILDLAAVRFCDCAGLNLFVRLQLLASAAGGWMHLAEPTPAIRRLIALTGLYDILPVEAGLVGAITAPAETPQPRHPFSIPVTAAWPRPPAPPGPIR